MHCIKPTICIVHSYTAIDITAHTCMHTIAILRPKCRYLSYLLRDLAIGFYTEMHANSYAHASD